MVTHDLLAIYHSVW